MLAPTIAKSIRHKSYIFAKSETKCRHLLIATAAITRGRHSRPAKLIPWEDIWTSLRVARVRGNGEMIEVFYDVLFKEAVFDDRGAWSWDLKKNFLTGVAAKALEQFLR